jgi:hypothetical protein
LTAAYRAFEEEVKRHFSFLEDRFRCSLVSSYTAGGFEHYLSFANETTAVVVVFDERERRLDASVAKLERGLFGRRKIPAVGRVAVETLAAEKGLDVEVPERVQSAPETIRAAVADLATAVEKAAVEELRGDFTALDAIIDARPLGIGAKQR